MRLLFAFRSQYDEGKERESFAVRAHGGAQQRFQGEAPGDFKVGADASVDAGAQKTYRFYFWD